MNITISEIRSGYPEDKKEVDRFTPYCKYLRRPLSFYLAWVFLRAGVSTNWTTLMCLCVGIIGCICLSLGAYWMVVVGALLINLHSLLDATDGNIARTIGKLTKYGEYIDGLVGESMNILIPIAVGIGLGTLWFLILGLSYSLLGLTRAYISLYFGFVYSLQAGKVFKPNKGFELYSLIYRVGVGLMGAMPLVLLIFALLDLLHIFLLLYIFLTVGELSIILWKTLRVEK